jgi:hypothetical protein
MPQVKIPDPKDSKKEISFEPLFTPLPKDSTYTYTDNDYEKYKITSYEYQYKLKEKPELKLSTLTEVSGKRYLYHAARSAAKAAILKDGIQPARPEFRPKLAGKYKASGSLDGFLSASTTPDGAAVVSGTAVKFRFEVTATDITNKRWRCYTGTEVKGVAGVPKGQLQMQVSVTGADKKVTKTWKPVADLTADEKK